MPQPAQKYYNAAGQIVNTLQPGGRALRPGGDAPAYTNPFGTPGTPEWRKAVNAATAPMLRGGVGFSGGGSFVPGAPMNLLNPGNFQPPGFLPPGPYTFMTPTAPSPTAPPTPSPPVPSATVRGGPQPSAMPGVNPSSVTVMPGPATTAPGQISPPGAYSSLSAAYQTLAGLTGPAGGTGNFNPFANLAYGQGGGLFNYPTYA